MATITAEVTDYKSGPKYARSFFGTFDRETKLWSIPVRKNEANGLAMRRLINGTFGNGLRVVAVDLEIGQWIEGAAL